MRNQIIVTLLTFISLLVGNSYSSYSQSIDNDYYDVNPGVNHGIRFWNSNAYKIHLTNSSTIGQYGPVSSYSIKSTMSSNPGRGFTWGVFGERPSTALSNTGNFQTKGWIATENTFVSTHHNGARFIQGDYGALHHNNGSSYHILLTNFGDQNGTWNNLRPFRIDLANGTTHLANTLNAHYGKIGINQTQPKTDFHLGQQFTMTSPHTDGGWGVMAKNSYYDGGHKRIVQDEVAEMIYTDAGDILFRTAPSGPAGSIIDQTDYIHTMKILNEGGVNICGTIKANEVIVEEVWWCDFVFEDDYNLPSIDEQIAFVEDNGHLVNFQSEEEMNGNIDLGDVTSRQQQTIEEQMLYIGQLHNMMKEMKNRIVSLESKLSE